MTESSKITNITSKALNQLTLKLNLYVTPCSDLKVRKRQVFVSISCRLLVHNNSILLSYCKKYLMNLGARLLSYCIAEQLLRGCYVELWRTNL